MLNKYPYTDFHELNLDWIIGKIKELTNKMSEFEALNKITFSGVWDITKQYPAWTIVNDSGVGYISLKPVPAGIPLTNSDYWTIVADYSVLIAGLQNRIISLEKNRLAWINAIEYGFIADDVNDAIMADFIANDADKVLYFPEGTYLFDNGFNFPVECHIWLDPGAILKLSDAASGVEYFISLRKGSTASDYTWDSFITGGSIDCNYKADYAFGCNKCRSNILSNLYIKNVLKNGIRTNTEGSIDGAAVFNNIKIENTKGIDETEVTGTYGIYDNGFDNMFDNIEIINMETGVYSLNGKFSNLHVWIRSKNLLQNSRGFVIDGASINVVNVIIDTYRIGFKAIAANPQINILNVTFTKNATVYTAAIEALYPIELFNSNVATVKFNVCNCDIRTGAVSFAPAAYSRSSFYNVTSNLDVTIANFGSYVRNDGKKYVTSSWSVSTDAYGQAAVQTYVSDKMVSIICISNQDYLVLRRNSGVIVILAYNAGTGTFSPVASSTVTIQATWINNEIS